MTSNPPILRARAENGESWDDPSEALLFTLLEHIEAGEGTFLIVERITDPTGETYGQALRRDNGTYIVEHREGDAQHHYGTVAPDLRAAHKLLSGWAFEQPGWNDGTQWTLVEA